MNEKELKDKLENLIKDTRNLSVANAVKYIEQNFPKNDFVWEEIYEESDFYIDHRDVIHLSNSNLSTLIIDYPGGDRLGSSLSDPDTGIYFVLSGRKEFDFDTVLFYKEQYNQDNRILEYLDELTNDYHITKDYALYELNEAYSHLPISLLEQLKEDHLQDLEIQKAIVSCVNRVATVRRSEAYNQYQYGHNGGEDIEDWQLSKSKQFTVVCWSLPNQVFKAVEPRLKEALRQMPEVQEKDDFDIEK